MRLGRTLTVAALAACTYSGYVLAPPAQSATTRPTPSPCRTWTVTAALSNDTGQPVTLRTDVGSLHRWPVRVETDATVPFTLTQPGRVAKRVVHITVTSLDYTGGPHPDAGFRFRDQVTVFRPASCTP